MGNNMFEGKARFVEEGRTKTGEHDEIKDGLIYSFDCYGVKCPF
jgi:hypothetical protein